MLAPEIERMAATVSPPTASPGTCGPTPARSNHLRPVLLGRSPNGSLARPVRRREAAVTPSSCGHISDNHWPRPVTDSATDRTWRAGRAHLGLPRMTSRPWS